MPQTIAFTKGHGTGNDFVIIPDADGELDLTDDQVAILCDRRFGIGGDGILRVVRSAAIDEGAHAAELGAWLDPVADRLTVIVVVLAFWLGGLLSWPVFVLILLPDVVLSLVALIAFGTLERRALRSA